MVQSAHLLDTVTSACWYALGPLGILVYIGALRPLLDLAAAPVGDGGMGKSNRGREDVKSKRTTTTARHGHQKPKRSRPALPRRRRSPSVRGRSVPVPADDSSPISPISPPPPPARPKFRLRPRVATPRGSVLAILRRPAAAVAAVVESAPSPTIWLWRKAWDDQYMEAGGTWRLLEIKHEDGKVRELWQWAE